LSPSSHSEGVNPRRRCPEPKRRNSLIKKPVWLKKDEILPLRFAQGQNDLFSVTFFTCTLSRSPELMRRGSEGMTKKKLRMTPLCHPEALAEGSPVEILRSLTLPQNDKKESSIGKFRKLTDCIKYFQNSVRN
jgi:hypothetical protein